MNVMLFGHSVAIITRRLSFLHGVEYPQSREIHGELDTFGCPYNLSSRDQHILCRGTEFQLRQSSPRHSHVGDETAPRV